MPHINHSVIWKMGKEDFAKRVAESKSYNMILKKFNIHNGGSLQTVRNRIQKECLDVSHFDPNWYISHNKQTFSLKDILVENSSFCNGGRIKKKLIKAGLKEDICEQCDQGPSWFGVHLVLQLDHINGNHTDNRIENLRILCPNCHTQTDTFCSKSCKPVEKHKCMDCEKVIRRSFKQCKDCYNDSRKSNPKPTPSKPNKECVDCGGELKTGKERCQECSRKCSDYRFKKITDRPSEEQVWMDLVECGSMLQLSMHYSKLFGKKISDNAIRKWYPEIPKEWKKLKNQI